MQKFQFPLLTYWLGSPGFLKEVAHDVVRTAPLCGNLQNMFNAKSHFTRMALHKHFLCQSSCLHRASTVSKHFLINPTDAHNYNCVHQLD